MKRTIAWALCAILFLTLCSCGAKEEKDPMEGYYGRYELTALESSAEALTEEVLARSLEVMNSRGDGPVCLVWSASGISFSGLGAGTDSASIDLETGIFTVSEEESYPIAIREDGAIVISVDQGDDNPFDMIFVKADEGTQPAGGTEQTQDPEPTSTEETPGAEDDTQTEGSDEEPED